MPRLLAILIACAALLAGCGGSDEEPPPYEAGLRASLTEFGAGLNSFVDIAVIQDDGKALEKLDQAAALFRSAADGVAELEPPAGVREQHGRIVSFVSSAAASVEGARELAEDQGLRVGLNSVPLPIGGEANGRLARLAIEELQRRGYDVEIVTPGG